ncbi:MAG: translocation/assembly module TamB domain-containing protein [candidate division Zixibacteria bacterium]|nr:translocation/assembly module TamB domain-containing protein [candidate division Zixibacteria bacterium]
MAWLIFAAALAVVIAFIAVFHFGLLEYGLNRELKDIVGVQAPVEVTIGAIEGDYFTALDIQDVQIHYDDGNLRYLLADIPRIRVMYSLADIWRGRLSIQTLVIDSAVFTVLQDTSGQWLIPRPIGREDPQPLSSPSFSIDLLALNHASVSLRGIRKNWRVDSLNVLAGVQAFEGAYALEIRGMTMKTNFHESRIASARGKFTLNGARLVFKDVEFDMQRAGFAADGFIALDSFNEGRIDLKDFHLDLAYLGQTLGKDLTGDVALSGSFTLDSAGIEGPLQLAGTFQGRPFESLSAHIRYADRVIRADTIRGIALNGCRIKGSLELDLSGEDERYKFDGSIQHLNIANLAPGAVQSDLSGRIELDGIGFRSATMKIDVSLDLDESELSIFRVHRARGDVQICTDSLRIFPGFSVEYFENSFDGAGKIEFGGAINVRGRAFLNNLERFDGMTFIEELGGRAQSTYSLSGDLLNPNISGSMYSDSIWLYEFFSANSSYDFAVDRFLTRRQGNVFARVSDISAWDFPLESISAGLRIDSNIVYFDSLSVGAGDAHLTTSGVMDYAQNPQPIKLSGLTLDFGESSYHDLDTVRMLYDTTGIEFLELPLKSNGETVRAQGRVNFDQSFDLTFELTNVNIAPWTSLSTKLPNLEGSLTCQAGAVGDSSDVSFYITGQIDSLTYSNLALGDLMCKLSYADKLLKVDTLHLFSPGGNHSLSGTVPLDLRIDGLTDNPFPAEQSLTALSTETNFDIVSFFLPQIEKLSGTLTATAQLSGTPFKPHLNGRAAFRGNELKIYELEVPAESLYLDLSMQNQFITIDSGSCVFPPRVRKPGEHKKFDARRMGRVTIAEGSRMEILDVDSIDYHISLTATNIPVTYTLGALSGKVDAELAISGVTPPSVTGKVNVISGLYEEEFLEEDAGYVLLSQFERPDSWDMNVDVTIVSNTVVRNSDMDAEFKGSANARRIRGLWSYVYNLEVIRGRVFLPASTFRLDAGGTVVNDDYSINNPNLNLIARRKVRVPQLDIAESGSPKTRQVDAVIQVTGTLDKPIISYYDDPSINDRDKISQDQLYEYLALGFQLDTRQSGWQAAGESAVEGAASALSASLTRAGARTIGVETFDINPDLDVERTEVTLGLYLSPQLYTYGKSDIGVSGQEVGFEYYIGRHLLLQGRRDEDDHYFFFLHWGLDW